MIVVFSEAKSSAIRIRELSIAVTFTYTYITSLEASNTTPCIDILRSAFRPGMDAGSDQLKVSLSAMIDIGMLRLAVARWLGKPRAWLLLTMTWTVS